MNPIFAEIRSALYLPASNARAIEKARGLPCDMVILDLEDSVKPDAKDAARAAAVSALADGGFGDRTVAIRLNGPDSVWHADDVAAVRASRATAVVVPKVESAGVATRIADACGKPLFAMIETPVGILRAAWEIAAARGGGRVSSPAANDLVADAAAAARRGPRGAGAGAPDDRAGGARGGNRRARRSVERARGFGAGLALRVPRGRRDVRLRRQDADPSRARSRPPNAASSALQMWSSKTPARWSRRRDRRGGAVSRADDRVDARGLGETPYRAGGTAEDRARRAAEDLAARTTNPAQPRIPIEVATPPLR